MPAVSLLTKGFIYPDLSIIVQQVALSPDQGQNLLAKALNLPLPSSMTEAKGIHQSDVIARTALVMAIADLRANPWLLDHVFASLIDDVATAADYGEKERARAKEWFLRTEIPVVMDTRMDAVEGTCVSISLVESTEAENTLGDVHYQPAEEAELDWPTLAGPFTPETYSAPTGIMKLPTSVSDILVLVPGMVILDRVGREHVVKDVLDRQTIVIAAGVVADFTNAIIRSSKPRLVRQVESVAAKETYRIGCHAHGEAFVLTWLHSIIYFCLLRYKQALLEARGFERSIVSNAPFAKDERFGRENMWTRFISITGWVRQYWPKLQSERILSVGPVGAGYSKVGETTNTFIPEDNFKPEDSPWFAQDGIGTKVE